MSMGRGIASMGKSQGGMRVVETGSVNMAKQADASWWLSGGIAEASVAGVWQPKGAASLDASYLRLAGDEGYADIDPAVVGGVAPTFGADGWVFNGTTQYLKSGLLPAGGWSYGIQLISVLNSSYVFGSANMSSNAIVVKPYFGVDNRIQVLNSAWPGQITVIGKGVSDGNVIIAGQSEYANGELITSSIPAWSGGATNLEMYIGGWNAGYAIPASVTIKCFCVYKSTITPTQAGLLSTAMAAL